VSLAGEKGGAPQGQNGSQQTSPKKECDECAIEEKVGERGTGEKGGKKEKWPILPN